MSDAMQANVPEYRRRCDHICLLDDGHVERGETHQHGYELPSPRDASTILGERCVALERENESLKVRVEQLRKRNTILLDEKKAFQQAVKPYISVRILDE